MKILQVIPYFSPEFGGDVNICSNLSRFLVKKGHDVTILTTDYKHNNEYIKKMELEGIKVISIKSIVNIGFIIYSPAMKRWLTKKITD